MFQSFKSSIQSAWFFIVLVIAFFFNLSASGLKKEADYLIIEDPSSYTFLNEFEQPASESEQRAFLPYSPLQIISLGEQLGDQITNAARFIYNNKTCYILTDEKRQRIKKKATWEKIIKKCVLINDTVKVKRTITLYIKELSGPRIFTVTKGSSLIRIFSSNGHWYCISNSGAGQYGWYQGSTEVFEVLEKQKIVPKKEFEIAEIGEKIKIRLDNANAQYDTFFTWFNTKTSQSKSIPCWTMTTEGNNIRCILKGSSSVCNLLEKSTHYIVSDLEHILLGKPYQALYANGEIIIRPRLP
jgi:hypothetical protein